MKKRILFCVLILAIAAPSSINSRTEPIAVVVNAANDITELKKGELSRIYKGQMEYWPDGQRLIVINRPADLDIRQKFYQVVLGEKPAATFLSPGSPTAFEPMIAESGTAARKFVARIPNAISYIYLSDVDETVKVLKIDDHLPQDAEYQLQ